MAPDRITTNIQMWPFISNKINQLCLNDIVQLNIHNEPVYRAGFCSFMPYTYHPLGVSISLALNLLYNQTRDETAMKGLLKKLYCLSNHRQDHQLSDVGLFDYDRFVCIKGTPNSGAKEIVQAYGELHLNFGSVTSPPVGFVNHFLGGLNRRMNVLINPKAASVDFSAWFKYMVGRNPCDSSVDECPGLFLFHEDDVYNETWDKLMKTFAINIYEWKRSNPLMTDKRYFNTMEYDDKAIHPLAIGLLLQWAVGMTTPVVTSDIEDRFQAEKNIVDETIMVDE